MAQFAWRSYPTRHFGPQLIPFAELGLKDRDDRWRSFSVQVDSGASISVLARSAGELLGLDVERGERIELAGVSAGPQTYYVHRVQARIAEAPIGAIRIAFADRENVPNLLGRLDVFDRLQVDFDPSVRETAFRAPWLDDVGRRIWNHFLETEQAIRDRWRDHPLPGRVDEAAGRMLKRAAQLIAAAAGLAKLHRAFEMPLILRALFDLSVQFEYMMQDGHAEERAALYLDYEHVSAWLRSQEWVSLPGQIGRYMRESPLRPSGEVRRRERFERVRDRYVHSAGSDRMRPHWYEGSLRDLARAVGREDEYRTFYVLFSAWMHADPFAARQPTVAHGGLIHAFVYWARMLLRVVDAKEMVLAADQYESLRAAARGIIQ